MTDAPHIPAEPEHAQGPDEPAVPGVQAPTDVPQPGPAELESRPVLVVDFGAQYAQLIARRVREARCYSEVVPHTMSVEQLLRRNPAAIVLSGGPSSVYAEGAPQVDPALFDAGVPVLGICYGFQAMASALGGEVAHTGQREFGGTHARVQPQDSTLFYGQTDEQPRAAQTTLSFENKAENGLGVPLPSGRVRVYQGTALLGEDRMANTPKDETVRLGLGEAFDVVGERKQVAATRPEEHVREETYSVTLRNHKDAAVAVDVVEQPYGAWTITDPSTPFKAVSTTQVVFPVKVPANGETVVKYTIRFKEQ